jgi:hypothetical protein
MEANGYLMNNAKGLFAKKEDVQVQKYGDYGEDLLVSVSATSKSELDNYRVYEFIELETFFREISKKIVGKDADNVFLEVEAHATIYEGQSVSNLRDNIVYKGDWGDVQCYKYRDIYGEQLMVLTKGDKLNANDQYKTNLAFLIGYGFAKNIGAKDIKVTIDVDESNKKSKYSHIDLSVSIIFKNLYSYQLLNIRSLEASIETHKKLLRKNCPNWDKR